MNSHPNERSVEVSLRRQFAASPERLFQAWTDPDILAQWWGPPGSQVNFVEIDLREGGQYRIGITQPNGAVYFVYGIYKIVKPPQKLAFTWRWEQPEMDVGNSLVTISFEAQTQTDNIATEVILTHTQLPNETARSAHREGWIGILENLSNFLQK